MKITLTGATGFVGRRLMKTLLEQQHSLHVLSRNGGARLPEGVRLSVWDPEKGLPPAGALAGAGAVVNLAGEPVAQRWTPESRRRIRDSRVLGTRRLVEAFSTLPERPAVLVSASAIGIYGSRGDEVLTEASAPGAGFLAEVCGEWEKQADLAESLGVRVVKLRTGVALDARGGALARMLPPFRLGVGGRVGSGAQWMSWIHLEDLVLLYRFAIEHPVAGVLNATAPEPVPNAAFTRTLAHILRRPAIFPVPAAVLKVVFGEMAEILLGSQRVLPEGALAAGFRFRYPELAPALMSLLQ